MDPNTKLILDEMNKRFTDLDLKLGQRFAKSESRYDARISTLEAAALAFNSWKPHVDAEHIAISEWKLRLEASVDDLKLEVTKLHKAWDRAVLERPNLGSGILENQLSASAPSPAGLGVDGPDGHRVAHRHQDLEFGKVFTHTHIPVKGGGYGILSSEGREEIRLFIFSSGCCQDSTSFATTTSI